MIPYASLLALSRKAERSASAKLVRAEGMDPEMALRTAMADSAGSAGIDALIATRQAASAAAATRLQAKQQRLDAQRTQRAARHLGAHGPWQGWFDGSAHPNPGRCGIGALLLGPDALRREVSRGAGLGNSSEAEYMALVALLHEAVAAQAQGLTIYGDSRVVIDDVTGAGGKAAPALRHLRTQARALMTQLDGVTLRWLPRHKNSEADALSQRAIAHWQDGGCEGA